MACLCVYVKLRAMLGRCICLVCIHGMFVCVCKASCNVGSMYLSLSHLPAALHSSRSREEHQSVSSAAGVPSDVDRNCFTNRTSLLDRLQWYVMTMLRH